jgi:multidrug efflux pump subunit AcrB
VKLTQASLGNPTAVTVAVLLVVLFGGICLRLLPVQLIPEVERPQISINTFWRAAAPHEVEAEILEPQERVLRRVPGMTQMRSVARDGQGRISMEFSVDMDMRRALVEVLNRLNQVSDYPADADEPVISTVGEDARPIAWFMIKTAPGNERDIASYQNYVEEVVQSRFERVPGVASSDVVGGRERELRVTFDPYKAAALGVELPRVAQLAGSARDVSGGFVDIGKREFSLRYSGQYSIHSAPDMILDWRDGRPIYLRDIADADIRFADRTSFVLTRGSLSIGVNALRESGVNVLQVMEGLRAAVDELQEGPLQRAGLVIEQVYDETVYIDDSINMLRNNLGLGIALAVIVLWWFLRRLRATLMVAVAIPICLLASLILMYATGRTLNVISFAGLAFAVGMVLDASIVVLENVVRLRERGLAPLEASLKGAGQVWGALLASTATTVAIFLPVVFLGDEAGQLFADLALGISAAIIASLLVALTVVPTAASQYLGVRAFHDPHANWWRSGANAIMWLTDRPWRRAAWILLLVSAPMYLTYQYLPKADYLPEGNRNLVFAFILAPPGASVDQIEHDMGRVVSERLQPHLEGKAYPEVFHYFYIGLSRGTFLGAVAANPSEIDELVPVINSMVQGFPDVIAFARKVSLFGGMGGGRRIDMDIQGRNLDAITEAAYHGFQLIPEYLPGAQVRPRPGIEMAKAELRLIPNERRLAEAGWDRPTLASVIRSLGDGLFVGDYFDGEETIDVILRSERWNTPEELATIPIVTPGAGILPLGELVDIVTTSGPEEIRRVDRRRTVTLEVTPPDNISLEEALAILQAQVQPRLAAYLPDDGFIQYRGTVDRLNQALRNMSGSFVLAIIILYLLISALFRSFTDSLLVILAIPLATVGGVIALNVINRFTFQPMDLLTMIGFVILLGLVVNNAILLVHQSRMAEREGHSRRDAVHIAVNLRLRPILMTTLTSIFGMLPLVLIPGPGTELYRGLAAVIVGGMLVSAFFTLLLLPSLLRIREGRHPGPAGNPGAAEAV